jgi:hypothetical protein
MMTAMKDTRWSWQPSEVEDLCRRLGWTLLEVIDGRGAVAEADLKVPGEQILMLFRDGHVDDITIQVTENVRESRTDSDPFISDTFADAVDEGVAVFGEPTDRQHAGPPTVRWRLADSTVLIKNLENAVTVTWASNRFQDNWDRVAEALE